MARVDWPGSAWERVEGPTSEYHDELSEVSAPVSDHGCINLLEFGIQREVAEHHTIGVGVTIDLDDNEEMPNFGAGIKYVFGMK